MRGRLLPAMGACLLCQGCQPPTYDILARLDGARLEFTARGSGSWPFRTDEDINADRFEVRDARQIVWAIERDWDRPACRTEGATPPFPLTYGETPDCYRNVVAPHRLAQGVLYQVEGQGFRDGLGFFRLEGGARNYEWHEVEAEVRSWPGSPDPLVATTPGDQRNAISDAAVTAAENAATSQ